MKKWLRKVLIALWPWSRIATLRRELKDARDASIHSYEAGYNAGINWHLHNWMANANIYYGPEPFRDGQMQLMMRLYQDGFTFYEALQRLRIAEGRDRTWTNKMN